MVSGVSMAFSRFKFQWPSAVSGFNGLRPFQVSMAFGRFKFQWPSAVSGFKFQWPSAVSGFKFQGARASGSRRADMSVGCYCFRFQVSGSNFQFSILNSQFSIFYLMSMISTLGFWALGKVKSLSEHFAPVLKLEMIYSPHDES